MTRPLRSALAVIGGPGLMAGLVPYLFTRWRSTHPPVVAIVCGAALIVLGSTVLLKAAARFLTEGHGTLAPFAPTDRLVIGGLYRYVRNPMYLAVTAVIVGEALVLGRVILLPWAGIFVCGQATFVRVYEEPTLRRKYGEQFENYRRNVRGWVPRLRPWA